MLETGYSSPPASLKLSQKDSLKAALIQCHCLIEPKASMDQFIEGLGITHKLIKNYPGLCKSLFAYDQVPLVAGEYEESFLNV